MTEAGRALAAKFIEYRGEVEQAIAAIEAEAAASVRAELAAKVRALPLYDANDRITAMDGTVREPRTMADAAEAYWARVLAILDAATEPSTEPET